MACYPGGKKHYMLRFMLKEISVDKVRQAEPQNSYADSRVCKLTLHHEGDNGTK